MIVTEVLQVKVVQRDPVFTVIDADGATQTITFTNGSGAQVMAGLARCALVNQRNDPDPRFPNGPVYALKDCRVLTTEKGEHGIALDTTEGFVLSIVLNQPMRRQLAACIEQIDNPHPPSGHFH